MVQRRSRIECLFMAKPSDARTSPYPYAADRESITKVLLKECTAARAERETKTIAFAQAANWVVAQPALMCWLRILVENRRFFKEVDGRNTDRDERRAESRDHFSLCALDRMKCKQNKKLSALLHRFAFFDV